MCRSFGIEVMGMFCKVGICRNYFRLGIKIHYLKSRFDSMCAAIWMLWDITLKRTCLDQNFTHFKDSSLLCCLYKLGVAVPALPGQELMPALHWQGTPCHSDKICSAPRQTLNYTLVHVLNVVDMLSDEFLNMVIHSKNLTWMPFKIVMCFFLQ